MKPVEVEIHEALGGLGGGERWSTIVMLRHGWDGSGGRTLEEVGAEVGLTRERVRQICSRAESRAQVRRRRLMPGLDAAIGVLRASIPCTSSEIGERLLKAGLSAGQIDGEGLVSAGNFFGRNVGVKCFRLGGDAILVASEMDARVGRGHQVARKFVGSRGVTTVGEVADAIYGRVAESQQERWERILRVELGADADVVWLDGERLWLWMEGLPAGRNRLLNNMKKVLSVCGRISAPEMRNAVRRNWRMGGYAPPSGVLLALADVATGLRREGSMILPVGGCEKEECLSKTELMIARVVAENGGVVRYDELERAAVALSISSASLRARVSQSPIVRKYAPGVYGLSGVFVSSSRVDELAGPTRREKVLQDCGWTDDGCVWISYKLSRSSMKAAVVSLPATVRGFVEGGYQLLDGKGTEWGTLVASEYMAWGLRRLLRVSGAEPGDSLVLVFDLASRKCYAYLGDEFALEEAIEGKLCG
jgi:hypothetical protein